jgi:ankyrin repeat protein
MSMFSKGTQAGSTPLKWACYGYRNLDVVKLLIHHGAHINDKDYVSL